ncbi:helix-turn-helix transcriptional regulator [Corynebacterium sp. H113]|uniref:helix-turn-helix transcriptional regulator n=1 Tax=Corynebacterium sp. H113 TaxID=3133419 RepID=UPI00309E4C84
MHRGVRGSQLDNIAGKIRERDAGDGIVVQISGAVGTGKSSIAHDLAQTLPGYTVTRVSALPWEAQTAGAVVKQVAARLGFTSRAELTDHLDAQDRSSVLVVDDAHHCDVTSLQFLIGLARKSTAGRIALVCCIASDARGQHHVTAPDIVDLEALADEVFELQPLDLQELASYVLTEHGVYLDGATVDQLHLVTHGWPGLVREVMNAESAEYWHQPGPEIPIPGRWKSSLQRRLRSSERVDIETLKSALSAIAITQGDCPLELLNELGHDTTVVDELVRIGFIAVRPMKAPPQVSFLRARDRYVVQALTQPGTTAELHSNAAEFYTRIQRPDEAAFHTALAEQRLSTESATALRDYVETLIGEGRWRSASALLRIAGNYTVDTNIAQSMHIDSIEALIAAGDIPTASLRAQSFVYQASTVQEESMIGYLATQSGNRGVAAGALNRARSLLDESGKHRGEAGARLAARMTLFHLLEWNLRETNAWVRKVGEWAEPGSTTRLEAELIGLVAKGALTQTLPTDEHDSLESPLHIQRRNMALGWLSLAADDPISARQHLQFVPGIEGSERISTWQYAWLARTHFVLGDFTEGAVTVERGLARAERFGQKSLEPLLLWSGAQIALFRGEKSLYEHYLSRMNLPKDSFRIQRIPAAMCRMLAMLRQNNLDAAVRSARELVDIHDEGSILQPGFWPWEDVAITAFLRGGHAGEAKRLLEMSLDRPGLTGSLTAKLMAVQAQLHFAEGDIKKAIALSDEAVEQIETLPMPAYRARILFEYGQSLRRVGKRRQAEGMFARAGEVYSSMGATAFVERCNRERRAAGLGPREKTDTGLTPQEHEIVALVMQGATNRDVASELYLSPKTVEYHLTRAYRKLGIRNRAELPAAMKGIQHG